MKGQKLTSTDALTALIRNQGIDTWEETIELVRSLPYGRNSNRTDLKLVITEQKGTCSSKHAMLKKVADLNKIPDIKLILGIYRMSQKNTPEIGNILTENAIDFIPEAHCYLKIGHNQIDVTTYRSDFEKIKNDLINELEILPEQVSEYKVEYHKAFIKNWLKHINSTFEFEHIWKIREKCIQNLTQ